MGRNNPEDPGDPWGGSDISGLLWNALRLVMCEHQGLAVLDLPLFATTPDNQIRLWQEISRGISPKR